MCIKMCISGHRGIKRKNPQLPNTLVHEIYNKRIKEIAKPRIMKRERLCLILLIENT